MCARDSRNGFSRNRFEMHPTAWVAPNAVVVGDVTLGARASVWYGCVLRGDIAAIRVGDETNLQDLTVVHVDREQYPSIDAHGTTCVGIMKRRCGSRGS